MHYVYIQTGFTYFIASAVPPSLESEALVRLADAVRITSVDNAQVHCC